MLSSHRSLALLGTTVTVVGLWAGCTVKEVDTNNQSGSTTGGNTTSTTSSSSGGGEGGGSTTSTTTGNGGSGGGAGCVGEAGTGQTAAACDTMLITPSSQGGPASSNCGPNMDEDPPGYGACLLAFDLYTEGSFENFQACLALITVEPVNACDINQVSDCVTKVYDEACDSADVAAVCDGLGTGCATDPFDVAKCKDDLRPFSNAGLQIYADCFNGKPIDVTCQDAHDQCFAEIQQ